MAIGIASADPTTPACPTRRTSPRTALPVCHRQLRCAGLLHRRNRHWTIQRVAMTDQLVEQMVGHRTRLAQQATGQRHENEDQQLTAYLERAGAMDRAQVWLSALFAHGWLVVGLATLAPALLEARTSPGSLAVSLGGILLAQQALAKLTAGAGHIVHALISWEQIEPLFQAAARRLQVGQPTLAHARTAADDHGKEPVVDAQDLVFRYRARGEPVLRGCSLSVDPGDRVLLHGPSGGGKSTLAAVLSGLEAPESGLLLTRGLDRQSLGFDGWRRRVVTAPQFHENHVFTETFAFNLLMGRRWPPQPGDMEQAEALCCDLGLDELLEKMPAGMLQMVGESGWQLSHGERSRLFMARALLQETDLVILDESFAALDPEKMRKALSCARQRAKTLLVIAHP